MSAAQKSIVYGAAGLLAAALGVVAALGWFAPRSATLSTGTVLSPPRPLPELALVDQDGAVVTRQRFAGAWTVLFAGFTSCPDVCPTTLAMLAAVAAQLEKEGHPLRVVLLSVDPERDTPERLKSYVRHFSPSFGGMTAADAKLAEAARAFGVAYAKVPGATPADYTMDHSAALVVIDPSASIAAYFTPPHAAETLAKDLAALMAARS